MATNATIEPTKLEDVLAEVEDLLLDAADDHWLLTESEKEIIVTFEKVATTAVEDGKPVIVGWAMADTLYAHNCIDSADFVGGAWPLSPACAAWVASNPDECTTQFDGYCRCDFDPLDH
jgi:hypothetical protein